MPSPIDTLRTRLSQASADRRITASETAGLLHAARKDGLSAEEARFLAASLTSHRDQFEPAAAEALRAALQPVPPGTRRDLADPAVLNKHAGAATHSWVQGQLFVGGVGADDVIQGSIANCYLAAALSSVASQSPGAVEDAIRDNGDGTFSVRFFEPSWGRTAPREVYVTVDGQLPTTGSGSLQYGKGRDRSELWVGLIEKAYAQWKGGYEAIGNGGSPGAVMGALVGRRDTYVGLSEGMNTQQLARQLREALASGKSVAACTHGKDRDALYQGSGLYAWHAYSVLGVSEEGGKTYVTLRNPWGNSEPGSDGANDGTFRLTVEEFAKFYAGAWLN